MRPCLLLWMLAGCGRLGFADEPLQERGDARTDDGSALDSGARDGGIDAMFDASSIDAVATVEDADAIEDADAASEDAVIEDAAIEDADATIEDADATIEDADATIEDADATADADATIEDADATVDADIDADVDAEVCNLADDDLDGFVDENLLVEGPSTVLSEGPVALEGVASAPERGEAAVLLSNGALTIARGDGSPPLVVPITVAGHPAVTWEGTEWFVAGARAFQRVSPTGVATPFTMFRTPFASGVNAATLHTGGRTLTAIVGNDFFGADGGLAWIVVVEGTTVLFERSLEMRSDASVRTPYVTAEGDHFFALWSTPGTDEPDVHYTTITVDGTVAPLTQIAEAPDHSPLEILYDATSDRIVVGGAFQGLVIDRATGAVTVSGTIGLWPVLGADGSYASFLKRTRAVDLTPYPETLTIVYTQGHQWLSLGAGEARYGAIIYDGTQFLMRTLVCPSL